MFDALGNYLGTTVVKSFFQEVAPAAGPERRETDSPGVKGSYVSYSSGSEGAEVVSYSY
jgi:hypothetical protein